MPPAAARRDAEMMSRALALAARALGRTHPNPPVGAVFVRGGRIVGEGFTAPAGGPHAEVSALRAAGARARGADLYVTLEPCTHHGRTPPCLDALLPLGLRRVVVAQVDPNPRVRGRGIRRLRAAGVRVEVGLGAAEADRLLAGFRQLITTGRPRVTLKLASTLDGRIAAASGDARWITSPASRRRAHQLRNEHDAVLVGAGTVRQDDPRLTCRIAGGRDPIRIVLAGRDLGIPVRAQVCRGGPPTWIVAPAPANSRRAGALRRRGVEVVEVQGRGPRVRFAGLMAILGARGLTTVLIEGGAVVAAQALRSGLVDRVVWFVAPTILGGDAVPAVGPLGIRAVRDAVRLEGAPAVPSDGDLVIDTSVRAGAFASPRRSR